MPALISDFTLSWKLILDNNSVDQSFQLYSGWLDARLRFYWWQICGRSSPCASPESRVNSALWFMAHDGRASRVVITLMPAWLEAELYSYMCEYIKSYSNSLIFFLLKFMIYGARWLCCVHCDNFNVMRSKFASCHCWRPGWRPRYTHVSTSQTQIGHGYKYKYRVHQKKCYIAILA